MATPPHLMSAAFPSPMPGWGYNHLPHPAGATPGTRLLGDTPRTRIHQEGNSANTSPSPPPPLPRDLQPLAHHKEPKAALTPETRGTTQQMSHSIRPPARQGTLEWQILSQGIIFSTLVLSSVKAGAARGLVERARGLGMSHPRRHSATHSLA